MMREDSNPWILIVLLGLAGIVAAWAMFIAACYVAKAIWQS